MKASVVYDSQYGDTEPIAQAIGDTLRGFGEVRVIRVDPAYPVDLDGVDMFIVRYPTQGWKPTPAMQSFLAGVSSERPGSLAVTRFDTRLKMSRWMTGSAAKVIGEQLREMGGALLASPESFFVKSGEGPLRDGEPERASTWTRMLVETVEATHSAARW